MVFFFMVQELLHLVCAEAWEEETFCVFLSELGEWESLLFLIKKTGATSTQKSHWTWKPIEADCKCPSFVSSPREGSSLLWRSDVLTLMLRCSVLSPMCSSCSVPSLGPRDRRIDLPDLGGWSPSKTVKPLWGKAVIVDCSHENVEMFEWDVGLMVAKALRTRFKHYTSSKKKCLADKVQLCISCGSNLELEWSWSFLGQIWRIVVRTSPLQKH